MYCVREEKESKATQEREKLEEIARKQERERLY